MRRKKIGKLSSKDLKKKTKKKLRKFYGGKKSRSFVYLTCKKCKGEHKIRVNNKEIYTEEVRKDWTCMLCK